MLINIPISQTYKCIDRILFEEELSEIYHLPFFKKKVLFINSDNTTKEREIFVSDNTLTHIKLFNDGIREAEAFFKERHSEIVEDRQRNSIFIDVKYLPEYDAVVIGNKHYDLTKEFSTFRIIRIDKILKINIYKNPDDVLKLIKKKFNIIIDEIIDYSNQMYSYKNETLFIDNLKLKTSNVISTSQHELFIFENKCYICMINNKLN